VRVREPSVPTAELAKRLSESARSDGRPQTLSYVDSEGANVWLAQYLRFRVAGNCDHASAESKVFAEIRGNGVQPDCIPIPTGPITEVLNGAVSGGSPSCTTSLGSLPCQVFAFTVNGSGALEALLTWSGGVNDLDLYLYRGTTLIARSIGVRNEEMVSAGVSPGAYQLRVAYYSGSTIQGFTLRVTRPR
jgi:hypothetical protein